MYGLNLAFPSTKVRPGPPPADPAGDFLARTSGLDAKHRTAYNSLINNLVADGVWQHLDALWVCATQDEATARLNLVSTNYTLTPILQPPFLVDGGYNTPNGSGYEMDTNFNPTVGTHNFKQDDNALFAWASSPGFDGLIVSYKTSGVTHIIPHFTDDLAYFRDQNSATVGVVDPKPGIGFYIANRIGPTTVEMYKDANIIGTATDASVPLVNETFTFLNGVGAALPYIGTCPVFGLSGKLDYTQQTMLYFRLMTFLTVVGFFKSVNTTAFHNVSTFFAPTVTQSAPVTWTGPTTNLTHRWPMDDANVSGTTITDVVAGLNGTAVNGVASAGGPISQARSFDGVNDYVSLPGPAFAVDVSAHAWTVGVWGYYEGLTPPTETNGALPRMFNLMGAASSALAFALNDDLPGGNQLQLCITTLNEFTTLADTVPTGAWAHFAMSMSSVGIFTVYIDGVAVPTGIVSGRLAEAANMIGCREGVTLTGMYQGRLSQLVTYDRELTPTEVTTLFAADSKTGFNPADKVSDVVLSNANRTFTTLSTDNAWHGARSIVGHSTGKYHVKFKINAKGTDYIAVGFGSGTKPITQLHGIDAGGANSTDSAGWASHGFGYYNGAGTGGIAGAGFHMDPGDMLAMELDLDTKKMRAQNITKATGWCADYDLSAMTGAPWFIYCTISPQGAADKTFTMIPDDLTGATVGHVGWFS